MGSLNPPVESWLLVAPYLVLSLALMIMAWHAGGMFSGWLLSRNLADPAPWQRQSPGMGLFLFIVRILLGLAVFSWIGCAWGIAGRFEPVPVFATIFASVIAGSLVAHRFGEPQRVGLARDWIHLGRDWTEGPIAQRAGAGILLLACCALAINAFIGALVPDFNHDPMWYHLPVAQQWGFDHRFSVYSSVMPSAYPLAVESLFAQIMLAGGDSVLCSLLMAWSGTFLFILMPVAAYAAAAPLPGEADRRGWALAGVAALWVPLLAVHSYVAPLQPKNDLLGLAWGFAGGMMIWLPILANRSAGSTGWWALGGLLLGTACSAKPNHLPVATGVMVFAALWGGTASGRGWLGAVKNLVIGGAAMGIAMVPWVIRAIQSHGIPLYPLGVNQLSLNPEFKPLWDSFDGINGFAGLSLAAWAERIAAFPARLSEAAITSEKAFFIYMIVAVALGLGRGAGPWRWYAGLMAALAVMVIGMKGHTEVFRFFLPAICLAAPALGRLLAGLCAELSPGRRLAALGVIGLAAWSVWVGHQSRMAGFATYAWEFRPVLGKRDVEDYAAHGEKGWTYLDFAELRPSIGKEDRVLLLGCPYPFYLHRDVLWNDEVVGKGGLKDRFARMTAMEGKEFLLRERIDVVLIKKQAKDATVQAAERLERSGTLQRVPLSVPLEAKEWRLYRVQ